MNKKWFSLVELVVAMSLVAILATISMISLTWYFEWVRDTNRITQINNIADGVALKLKDGEFLRPEWAIEIQHNWWKVSYQWYFGKTLLDKIEFSMDWTDPENDSFFTYIISADGKYFQMMTFLEDDDSLEWIWYSWTIIKNNEWRTPYIVWSKEIWVFLNDEVVPIHEYASSPLNIVTASTEIYNVILQNDKIVSASWDDLFENIDKVVKNFGDSIYSCASQPYAYANYLINTPTTSNTAWQNSDWSSPCYFACKTGFGWNWTNCEPSVTTQTVPCIWKPSNSIWNSTSTVDQTWNISLSDFLPTNVWVYNTTSSTSECRFECAPWYAWDSGLQECTVPTRVFACIWNPLNSSWNTATNINQEYISSVWTPSETPFYSSTIVTDQCAFDCDSNYTWNGLTTSCEWSTRLAEVCTWLPSNASWNTVSNIDQTWDWSSWVPSVTGQFNTTASTTNCNFVCDLNYTWNWLTSSCEADTLLAQSCTWLPANATWNLNSTIDQTWNGSSWLPTLVWYNDINVIANECNFKCNSWFTWTWFICEASPVDLFRTTLTTKCWVTLTDFNTNFNETTGVYNWDINCSLRWLNDSDLDTFDPLVRVNWYLDLEKNNFTHIDWLSWLQTVIGYFKLNDNNITDISWMSILNSASTLYLQNNNALSDITWLWNNNTITFLDISWNNIVDITELWWLTTLLELKADNNKILNINSLSSLSNLDIINLNNNDIVDLSWIAWLTTLEELYLANNDLFDISDLSGLKTDVLHIYWNNSIDNLSAFDGYSHTSKTIALDDRAYTRKIWFLSDVCWNWTIRDQTLNTVWDKTNICLDKSGSTTWLNGSMWNWYVDWWTNSNWTNWWYYGEWSTPSSNTWPDQPYEWRYYLYAETSYPGDWYSTKTSILSYDIVDTSNYLNFRYHAYWSNMWTLQVIANDGTSDTVLYTRSWQKHNRTWKPWKVTPDISIPSGTVKISLKYTSWYWYTWDFSIDLIEVWEK